MKSRNKTSYSPREYPFVLTYENDDKVYVARAVDLPGCHSEGKTPAEAVRNVYEAIKGWIETARKDHVPIPPPTRLREEPRKFLLRIEPQNVLKLDSLSVLHQKSLNKLINEAIQAL